MIFNRPLLPAVLTLRHFQLNLKHPIIYLG